MKLDTGTQNCNVSTHTIALTPYHILAHTIGRSNHLINEKKKKIPVIAELGGGKAYFSKANQNRRRIRARSRTAAAIK